MQFDIPIIETERLVLRDLREADFACEQDFMASDAAQFVGGPKKPHEAWRNMAMLLGHWILRGYGFWALEEKATGLYQGRVGLWYPHGWYGQEIGWTLMPHAQGKGYATEAARRARAYAYEVLNWQTAISQIAPENHGSKAVTRRLGASFESLYDDPQYGAVEVWRHLSPAELAEAGDT